LRSRAGQVIVSAVTPALPWALLATSLVVGLAALVRMAGPPGSGVDDLAGIIRLPSWLRGTIGGLFAVAALVFLLDLARRMRGRRSGEGELVLVPEAVRLSPWQRLVKQVSAFAYFAVFAYLVWKGVIPLEELMALVQGAGSGAVTANPADAAAAAPPIMTWTFGVFALAAALGALALAVWVALGDRLQGWWERREEGVAPPEPFVEAVVESLEDLHAEPDARRAVIRCYARFQRVAAESGLPRQPWHTPTEFMGEALARLPAPRRALASLTGLFELARFSDRALGHAERQRALSALDEIRVALEEGRGDALAR
jgi:hypothetical protein